MVGGNVRGRVHVAQVVIFDRDSRRRQRQLGATE
jgi:hypothetical protein